MSSKFSVKSEKPEKCAIEQKKKTQGGTGGGDSAVQQSQVSSSKPTIITDDILGPLLLEALDSFLFVLNLHGKVEFVSENVTHFLKYVQDELIGKSVFNIIHAGDHTLFSKSLLSVGGKISWPTDNLGGKGPVFNCRFLVKPLCTDDLEANQTDVHQYESMQISSIHHSQNTFNNVNTENSDSGSSFVCIARRLPLAEKTNTMLGSEQFTTKQDLQGKIIGCDISGITQAGFNCPVLVGQKIQDFCFANDIQDLSKHFQEVVRNGSNTSGLHRFKMLDKRFVYVQTMSKLFQNPVTGLPEFIMSNHSIVRDCDNDKGTASSSLMNAIIAPSLQKKQTKSMPHSGSMPMTSKSVIGGSVTTNLNSSKWLGISDSNLNEEFLNQILTLDLPISSGSSAFQGSQFMTTSNSSILNPQLSISQVYQQFQRNSSNSSANVNQQQASNVNLTKQLQRCLSSASGDGNQNNNIEQISKKHPVALATLGKRSSSLELSQVQNQAQLQQQSREQKSSLYAQSPSSMRNVVFSNPMQRVNTFGYQRQSPAASPVPNVQGNFSTPFPPNSPSSSGLSQPLWNQQSAISQGKLGCQQSDSQIAATSLPHYHHLQQQNSFESILRQQNSFESTLRDKKVKHPGKHVQNSSPSGSCKSEPGMPNGTRSRHNSCQGMMEMSPSDSIQSPQSRPGQSPPEKSQSTSTNVGDPHHLLKTLLSQEDDAGIRNLCSVKCEQTAVAQSDQKKHGLLEIEKNEPEAKMTHNILLKHLLSTDFNSVFQETITTDSSSKMTASLAINDGHSSFIRKLLEDQMDTCRSVPAESTSVDSDSDQMRRRHQSEPQKTQSAASHLSSLLTSPMTPLSGHSTVDMSLLKDFLSTNLRSGLNVTNTSMPINVTFSGDSQTINRVSVSGMGVNESKKVDKLLNLLWEDNSQDGNLTMKERIQNLKRKADLLDMESSDRQESAVRGINSSDSSRLLNENALLMQLLSKKGNNDIVVNTLSTIQPSGIPQSRIPPGISNKLLKVKPSTSLTSNEPKRARFETGNGQFSTQERALNTLKIELTSSSNQSFNTSLDIGLDSNSGISNISDTSESSQLKKQFNGLQQILSNSASDSRNNSSVAIEVNVDDNTDPLLAQILQQAQELQHDITAGTFLNVNQSGGLNLQSNSGMNNVCLFDNSSSSISSNVGVNNANSTLNQNNSASSDLLQQLELALSNPNLNLNEIDNLIGNSSISFEEQTEINAIQEQLMMEMTGLSAASSAQNTSSSSLISCQTQHRLIQNTVAGSSQLPSYQMPSNILEGQANGMHTSTNAQFEHGLLRVDGSDVSGLARSMLQLPSYSQVQGVQNFPGQGPRLLHHQGALPSPNQPQRPVFSNSDKNSTTMQQQKSKHMQEQDKQRLQQQQNCQKLVLQQHQQQHQQQQQPFSPQYTQQFPRSSTQYNNCLRSMSGGTLQASTPQQFPILDSTPYQGNQTIYPSQLQQQQLYQQNRVSQIQRQISMPARTSPRTSQSPFGPDSSSDPLIISPGTGRAQTQQMSPSYNHGALGSSYGQGSILSASNTMPLPQYSQVQGHMGMTSSNMDMDLSLFDNHKKPVDMSLSNNTSTASQTIKRELRNICNARSQAGILQSQTVPQQPLQQHVSQQQLQHHQVKEQGSELPDDILEQITEMSEEHGMLEDDIIRGKQEEARNVYEKFWQLTSSDGSESKAISLFRNQLSQESIEGVMSASEEPCLTDLQAVQIINQLRKPVEAINIADQKTGLLQKLLL